MENCPRAAIFDLDNTLAPSFEAPAPEIVHNLEQIMRAIPVAVMSAASIGRMEQHLLPGFSTNSDRTRLYLFPSNGSACYTWQGVRWQAEYNFKFTPEERARIIAAIEDSVVGTGVAAGIQRYGEHIIDYGGHIAFTVLGRGAPREEKLSWDPDGAKRRKLKKAVQAKTPGFDVYIGGTTSIDIMCKGVNKAHSVEWLARRLKVKPSDMLFVGDALYPDGNDEVVIATGVRTIQVAGPHETVKIIEEILAACKD